ncbi:MAG: hypothetical protein WCP46_00550 [Alphaproteobacteria bacterium]
MTSILIIFGILVLVGITSGYFNSTQWAFSIGINTFKYPTFDFGVSSRWESNEDGETIQVVTIGMVLIILEFEFLLHETE